MSGAGRSATIVVAVGVDNTTLHPVKPDRRKRARMVPVLEVVAGCRRGQAFELHPGTVVVGKDERADICLGDSGVSRRHAKIVVASDGGVSVVDLASSNGTFVGDAQVDVAALREGDRVQLGPTATLRLCYRAPAQASGQDSGLSDRQLEVARLVAQGLTNAQIAESLAISPRTVARHLDNIYARLDLRSRAGLTRWVVEHRLS
jgi:DNA-binding CsgD family transcriptional regulator